MGSDVLGSHTERARRLAMSKTKQPKKLHRRTFISDLNFFVLPVEKMASNALEITVPIIERIATNARIIFMISSGDLLSLRFIRFSY